MTTPAPGWYAAPHAQGEQRFWDGQRWHDVPPPAAASAPAATPTPAAAPATNPGSAAAPAAAARKPLGAQGWQIGLTIALLVLSLLGIAAAWLSPVMPYRLAFDGGVDLGLSSAAANALMIDAVFNYALLVVTWVVSIWLLATRRVAFYVPLVAGMLFVLTHGAVIFLVPVLGS
jgi:hypothetical protein